MTIPVSSASAARQWLFTQFTAQLTPDPVSTSSSLLVCYDEPGPNQPDDIVTVGKISRRLSVNSMVGGGGAGFLEERYSVEIGVDVFRGGDDAQAAFQRAEDLTGAIIAAVRTDLTLGNSVLVAKPLSDQTEVIWDEAHMGRHATTTLEIECYQRI